jgi:hypothetical protein
MYEKLYNKLLVCEQVSQGKYLTRNTWIELLDVSRLYFEQGTKVLKNLGLIDMDAKFNRRRNDYYQIKVLNTHGHMLLDEYTQSLPVKPKKDKKNDYTVEELVAEIKKRGFEVKYRAIGSLKWQ